MTISRTTDVLQLGRENRFIIDDPDCHEHLAYVLSKPLREGKTYNGDGVFAFVMQEVETADDDDLENCIADYYKYYPRLDSSQQPIEPPQLPNGGSDPNGTRKVWL